MHYSISDFIVDIAQNSCEAGARSVEVRMREDESGFGVVIRDDGRGMDSGELARALDPFYTDGVKHPARKVGLGLPFLKQALDQNGGSFLIESKKGVGTEVSFRFDQRQVDCPPPGDLASLIRDLLCLPGGHEMTVARQRVGSIPDSRGRAHGELDYTVVKSEIAEALGDIETASSLALLARYLHSQEGDDLWQG